MITYCLNCGAENSVRIYHDSLGSHCVCPICEASYPVDDPREGVSNLAWRENHIIAVNKRHFDSLVKEYRSIGYMIITYGRRLAEMEKGDSFLKIEY